MEKSEDLLLQAPNASSGPNSYTSKVIAEREELNDVARNRSLRAAGNSSTYWLELGLQVLSLARLGLGRSKGLCQ